MDLDADYFSRGYTADPTVLFRIFHYPPAAPDSDDWGVGEHTDYGLLTLLAQDANGGLQVRSAGGWIEAPPIPGSFVCNIGDMLDRLTGGWYRSTPHRVRNLSGRDRLSFPFFLDPDFTAEIPPLPHRMAGDTSGVTRWDGRDLQAFTGTYGEYLIDKVSHVFPQLRHETPPTPTPAPDRPAPAASGADLGVVRGHFDQINLTSPRSAGERGGVG